MTQRMATIAHAGVTGVLGFAVAVLIMVGWNVVRTGRPQEPNWGTAIVLAAVLAATRPATDRRCRGGA
ncbi:MAG: hypothetical protein EHM24_25150 [Acidobacteria bacterium]|nr:MAG: hypothetical protein EHM24_25150 [Acidobacteriota bacterium]